MFDDYIWRPNGSLYSEYNGKLIPSRIPLSALLAGKHHPQLCPKNSLLPTGPVVGGPWPLGDDTPLSVSREFFRKVCPNPTAIKVSDINTDEMRFSDDISAVYVFEKWVETINSIEDPCVMLDPSSNQVFEFWYAVAMLSTYCSPLTSSRPADYKYRIFGHKKRMLTIWPYLAKSPVSTHWDWSPFIHDAFRKNRHVFESTKTTLFGGLFDSQEETTADIIPGLLAIHVRRGDFEDHCAHLAKWNADWHAFNSFPEFRDKFNQPTDGGWGETSEENAKLYVKHCYPSIEQIVEKVRRVRVEAADPLRYLYILTNGPTLWVEELESALAKDTEWDHVGSSRDLKLTWEQKFVAQALDMYVAQRAQVFIGNGVSGRFHTVNSCSESGIISGPV